MRAEFVKGGFDVPFFHCEECWGYEVLPDGTVEIFDPVIGVTHLTIPAFLAPYYV